MRASYILRRIGLLFLVLWTAASLNFVIPRLTPRNPIEERLIQQATTGGYLEEGLDEMVKAYEAKFGLDKPLLQQYANYMWDMARLDLGYSLAFFPKRVTELIAMALPWTIGLLGTATLLAFVIGSLFGALIAWPRSPQILQYLLAPFMMLSAVPFYLFALVLIYFLAFRARIFPLGGAYAVDSIPELSVSFALEVVQHSILPALSMILAGVGGWALGMRGMMVTVQGEDYMLLAEANGLKRVRLFLKYGIRNALLPQVTGLGLSLGRLVSGAVLVEAVFGYPGIGSLLNQSIRFFDYFVIYGIVFMVILAIGIATLTLDLIYPLLDPRIRYEEG